MKCIICNKDFEGRSDAKYCSANCRVKASRGAPQNISPPTEKEPTPKKNNEAFEDYYPNYYILQDEPHTSKCYICKQSFTSNMRFLKFCSPEHQQLFLKTVTDQYKPHSLGDVK